MNSLQRAIDISVKAHSMKTRKNGTPYILHPIRVMMKQNTEDAMITAILHDVVEDSDITLYDLRMEGFSEQILDALALLTHDDDTSYEEYILRISKNALASVVKIADLEDNMNLAEIPEIQEKDLKRLAKYHSALKKLKQTYRKTCADI